MKHIHILVILCNLIIYISCSEENNIQPKLDEDCIKINDTLKITLISGDTNYYTKWIREDRIHVFDSLKYSREYNQYNVFTEVWRFKAIRIGEETIVLNTYRQHDSASWFSSIYSGKVCE